MKFDVDYWEPELRKRHIHEQPSFVNRLTTYNKARTENARYVPFTDLAKHIVEECRKTEPHGSERMHDMTAEFVPLGNQPLPSRFCARKPDVFGAKGDVQRQANGKINLKLLTWEDSLYALEFKKGRYHKRKLEEEADVQPQGSAPKRSRGSSHQILVPRSRGYSSRGRGSTSASRSHSRSQPGHTTRSPDQKNRDSAQGSVPVEGRSETETLAEGSSKISSLQSFQLPSGPVCTRPLTPPTPPSPSPESSRSRSNDAPPFAPLSFHRQNPPHVKKAERKPDIEDRFTAPPATKAETQLANYAMQMLSSSVFREWAIGGLIDEDKFTLWYYDRTCALRSAVCDWKSDSISFMMIILALARETSELWGINTLFRLLTEEERAHEAPTSSTARAAPNNKSRNRSRTEDAPPGPMAILENVEFTLVKEKNSASVKNNVPTNLDWDTRPVIQLYKNRHRQCTLFGRATRVDDVKVGRKRAGNGTFESLSDDHDLVMKGAWQVKTRKKEHEIIQLAREVDPEHTPALFAYAVISRKLPADDARELCKDKPEEYEERHFVLLIFRKYRHAFELKGPEYLNVWIQAVICHRRLFVEGRILHRDLSLQNIMMFKHEEPDEPQAIINDYDLSIILNADGTALTASSKHRTGTAIFMAYELLLNLHLSISPSYCHDVESLFYILLWTICGYGPLDTEDRDPLNSWRHPDWRVIATQKLDFVTAPVHNHVNHLVPDHYESRKVYWGLADLISLSMQKARKDCALTYHQHEEILRQCGGDRELVEQRTTCLQAERFHDSMVESLSWEAFAKATGMINLEDIERLRDPPLNPTATDITSVDH